jgi:dipeptidase E
MKLLLTSAGLKNKTIADVLIEMVGKPAKEISVAFIPTAANYERGDKDWLIGDLVNLKKQNFKSIDVIDISALPQEKWLEGFKNADVLFFGGGNTFHLMYWVKKSGLQEILPDLLKDKVYAGISAGSCITSPKVEIDFLNELFPKEKNEFNVSEGLNLVPFYIIPHLNSYTRKLRESNVNKILENVKEKVYVIDNQCAIKVVDDSIEVIGQGKHFELNV